MLGFLPDLNIVLISSIVFYFRSCHTNLIWTLVIILGPASYRVEREPKLFNSERIWLWVRDCCYLGGTSGRTCMMCTGTLWLHAGSGQARFGLWTLRHKHKIHWLSLIISKLSFWKMHHRVELKILFIKSLTSEEYDTFRKVVFSCLSSGQEFLRISNVS